MKTRLWLWWSVLTLGLMVGCSRRNVEDSNFEPLAASSHNNLVVLLSSMTVNGTGSVATYHLTTGASSTAEHPVSANAGLRYFPGEKSLYIVNRFGSDSLQAFFLNGLRSSFLQLALPEEKEGGEENSFEDIWVNPAETFAYLSRLNGSKLLKVDLATRKVTHRTDLSVYSDRDGMPEMSRVFEDDGTILVQLQRLARSKNLWVPAGGSTLAKVDAETGDLLGDIPTVGQNPFTDFAKGSDGRIYYGTSGEWDKVCAQCGLESVSLADDAPRLDFSEEVLGGKIVTFALGASEIFFVIHPHGEKGTKLIAINQATRAKRELNFVPYVEEYQSLAFDADRKLLYAGRKSINQPVIELWNTETLTKWRELKAGLAPMQLILVP